MCSFLAFLMHFPWQMAILQPQSFKKLHMPKVRVANALLLFTLSLYFPVLIIIINYKLQSRTLTTVDHVFNHMLFWIWLLPWSLVEQCLFVLQTEIQYTTVMCLSVGTSRNKRFSISPKWKVYFYVSHTLGRLQPSIYVLQYWDT